MKGMRGIENNYEYSFDRIRVFTWRPSKKCSKPNAHPGRCDSKRAFHEFWKSSTSHVALKRKGQLNEENRKIEEEAHTKKARLDEVGKYHRVYMKALSFSFFIYLIRTELYVNNLYKLIFYFIF